MSNNSVKIVKNFRPPRKEGVYYRLLSLTGVNKGTSYYLEGNRAVIGRSEKVEISILDPKASREHAEIVRVNDNLVITDLKSQNGIVINDLKVVQHTLTNGDRIIIGSTVFKFDRFEVEKNLVEYVETEAGNNRSLDEVKKSTDSLESNKPDNKKKIFILLAVVLVFLMLDEDEESTKKPTNTTKRLKDVSSSYEEVLQKKKEKEVAEEKNKVEGLIHRGQREFREENYFRALEEFNQALIMDPGNGRASFYKRKTKQALDNSIEEYFTMARREVDSLKLESAMISYCAIMRILEGYEEDERYKQSERQIRYLEKKIGMVEGDYKCIAEQ